MNVLVGTAAAEFQRHVCAVVAAFGGDRRGAARALGVSERTLYGWLRLWGTGGTAPSGPRPAALTSGQCAAHCGVAPRTITKWIDSGALRGHTLPLSADRRVYADDLVKFLKDRGLRVPRELAPPVNLSYGLQPGETVPGFVPVAAFELLSVAGASSVAAALVGDADGTEWAGRAGALVRGCNPGARLVLVVSEDRPPVAAAGLWSAVHRRPVDLAAVAAELAGEVCR